MGLYPQCDQREEESLGQARAGVRLSQSRHCNPREAASQNPGGHDGCLSSPVVLSVWLLDLQRQQHLRTSSKCIAVLNQTVWARCPEMRARPAGEADT